LRINRILSLSGICSRRKADELILQGRVKLNERIVRSLGVRASWGKDSIKVDGREIPGPSDRAYLMLNKPFGYICSLKDPGGRPVVTDLLKGVEKRVYPVGRLDFDSLGLLLLTDDGEFAHRLTHPRYRVPRTYKVTAEGQIPDRALEALKKGLYLEDGFSGQAKVTLLQRDHKRSVIRMTVTSGKNRLIRRMLGKVGHEVIHLVRIGFGPLELSDLKVGDYRPLDENEILLLKKMVHPS